MKRTLLLFAMLLTLIVANGQVKHYNAQRNGYTNYEVLGDVEAIKGVNDNINMIERIGDYDGHFIYLLRDDEGYFLDILVYNYLDSKHTHNGQLTGRRVYWLERNLKIKYPEKKREKRTTLRSEIVNGVSYKIIMDDDTEINITYSKNVNSTRFTFVDTALNVKSRAMRGLYIEDSEISSN